MAVVKNLMVRAGADFSAITKQAKKASSSMQSMRSSVTNACEGMSKAAAGLKKAFAAVGIGLSAAAVVNFAKDAAAAYDEQAESQVKLARVMRNTMGASNDQIQSILDLADAQQQLGVVAGDVQIAGAQELATYLTLSDSLQTLIPVMNDMAAQQYGYNVTAEQTTTIATMLGKVMNGQVGALSRYGYTFDEAQEKILKYGTEAQRAAVLAEVVEQSVGGMNAALAATPTGRMKQLSNTLGDIKAQFGQAVRTLGTVFLPVLNTVAKVLAAIATLANKVAQTIANVFGGKAAGKEWKYLPAGAAASVSDTSEAVDSLTDAEKKSGKAAEQARKEQEKLQNMSFDTLEIMADHSSSSYSSGSGSDDSDTDVPDIPLDTSPLIQENAVAEEASEGLGKLEAVLEKLKAAWEDFKSKLNLEKIGAAFDKLKESLARLGESLAKVGSSLWTRILEPLAVWVVNDALPVFLEVLSGALDVLSATIDTLRPAFEWLWDTFLQPIANWMGDNFIENMENIATRLERISKVISGEMSIGEFIEQLSPLEVILDGIAAAFVAVNGAVAIWTGVQAAVQAGAAVMTGALAAINWPLTLIIIGIGLVIAAGVALYQNWDTVCAKLKEGAEDLKGDWERIKASLAAVGEWFAEKGRIIADHWHGMVEKIKVGCDELKQDWEGIRQFFSNIIQRIKNLLNFTWSFPKPKMPHFSWTWERVGRFLSIPRFKIDWYAKGGIVDGATLIGAGEAGKEAIVPLERNMEWVTRVADQIRREAFPAVAAGGMDGDLSAMANAIYQAVFDASRDAGGSSDGVKVAEWKVGTKVLARAIFQDLKEISREKGISMIDNFA